MVMKIIHAPRQERSRQTYEAILDSAERLLRQKSFGDVSLTEICGGANCTTGAFYHRFANKQALLLHLEDRVYEDAHKMVDEVFLDPGGLTGSAFLHRFIAAVVDYYVNHKGSVRALTLASLSDPEVNPRIIPRMNGVIQRGSEYLATRLDLRGRDPERSIEFALVSLKAALREIILFGDESLGQFPREVLITELMEQFTRYLALTGDEL